MTRRKTRIVIVAATTAVAAVLGACSSSSSTSGSNSPGSSSAGSQAASGSQMVTEAKSLITKSSGKLNWFQPGPAFSAKKPLKGSNILFITVQLNTPFSQNILKGLRAGAALVGGSVSAADSGGSPSEAARQVAQGVSQKVSAIVIQGIPSAAISAALGSAASAHIPVIMLFDQPDTGIPSAAQKKVGVVGNVDMCWKCEGSLMADASIVAEGSKTNAVFIYAKELTSAAKQEVAYTDEIHRLCSSCSTKSVDVPVAQWSTGLQDAANTALSDPNVNVLAPVYDLMIPAAEAAASASQSGSSVSIVSGDATDTGVVAMSKNPNIKFLAGGPSEWAGWLAIDQWLRYENGQPAAPKSIVPVRAITAATIKNEHFDLSSNADQTKWFTSVNLKQEFSKLWGVTAGS